MKKKVYVGMSGGVDSAVTALLLKEAGYEVHGVTLRLWSDEEAEAQGHRSCCGPSAVEDASRVASRLGILYSVWDFQDLFREKVVDPFVEAYCHARTPNPCIPCNRWLKWGALWERAKEEGADAVATGHYARILTLPGGRLTLARASFAEKDQTYALCSLTQEQLAHTLLPLGTYHKVEVRRIASEAGLLVAQKPDSQDICFVPDGDYAAFLERERGDRLPPPGDFVLSDGTVLGRHGGLHRYTIGQRKGLGISWESPLFVKALSPSDNRVILGGADEVFTDRLLASDINYVGLERLEEGARLTARIRYSHEGAACTVHPQEDGRLLLVFDEPVRAATPGQTVVLYLGDWIAASGTICR